MIGYEITVYFIIKNMELTFWELTFWEVDILGVDILRVDILGRTHTDYMPGVQLRHSVPPVQYLHV